MEEQVEYVEDENVGSHDLVGDDEAHLEDLDGAAVAPEEGEGVQVDGALHDQRLQPPEEHAAKVERHLALQDLMR